MEQRELTPEIKEQIKVKALADLTTKDGLTPSDKIIKAITKQMEDAYVNNLMEIE